MPFKLSDKISRQLPAIVILVLNPFNAEASFVQSTRTQRSLKTLLTLSSWYSLNSSRQVISDEYPFARCSVIFQVFYNFLYRPNYSHQRRKGQVAPYLWYTLEVVKLTLVSQNCNYPYKSLMANCNGDYWPKSSTRWFTFEDLVRFC